jgi:hypothetical protein
VWLSVTDDLARQRATVFFRLILALPHLIVLGAMAFAALLIAPVAWFITLLRAELPPELHEFYGRLIRYSVHVSAYLHLAAEPWPPFLGGDTYAVDVGIPAPQRHNRWSVGFRGLLAFPALMLSSVLGAGLVTSYSPSALYLNIGVLPVAAVLAWFAILATGRMPQGLRDLVAYAVGYGAQAYAYFFFLTPAFPDSNPAWARLPALPEHPVALAVEPHDPYRHRLLVFFRGPLTLPHYVWLGLWGIPVFFTAILAWFAALATGQVPRPFHRFLSAYVRQLAQVAAFFNLTANPFPGFVPMPYPVELGIAGPERQNRWTIGFRLILALPALLLVSALSGVLSITAVLGWFASLFTAKMPHGLRNLSAYAIRYSSQAFAYALLLTPRYPYAGPGRCEH